MAWSAGTANAASDAPDPLAAPAATIQDVPVPVAAVPFPVSGTAATVVAAVDPAVSGTTEVVANVADSTAPLATEIPLMDSPPVDTVSATVTATVDQVVAVVDSPASALPEVPVPLPEVPLPHIPVPLPEKAAPVRAAGTAVPPSDVRSQAAEPVSGVEAASPAGRVRPAEVASAPQHVRLAVSPLQFLANTQGIRVLGATIGYVVSAVPAPEEDAELRFAGTRNQSGPGSTGSGSAGAEASADVAGFWNLLHDAGRCLVPDAALILHASPAFDPGSSPD
ncbi:hypothetical protein ACFVWT_15460 [Arthrobacter sp. NPDC058288]|uniref:hypothetical protein n=1 Tax=Arthrobacter sp. NPDC058288 TaxID=3346424 RepID=UPI0036E3A17F